jgi:hypothetical protein
MKPLIDLPGVLSTHPLCIEFRSMDDVEDHCAQIHSYQGEPWQRDEYRRACRLASKSLPSLFDRMTMGDLRSVRWDEIADDVRMLSTLPENPL